MDNCIIVQVFDQKFSVIKRLLKQYADLGITHVQLSPVQRHCVHTTKWYRLYQPSGSKGSIGNSLGSQSDLAELIKEAHNLGIRIIIDIVIHHRTGCPICNPQSLIYWSSRFFQFAYFKFLGGPSLHSDRFNCTDWGPKEDLTNKEVKSQHLDLLKELVEMGVDGFRFDAAKHIPPEYLQGLVKEAKQHANNLSSSTNNNNNNNSTRISSDLLCYGEVMDSQPSICEEYTSDGIMKVTDFPLTFALIGAMAYHGDTRSLNKQFVWPPNSICLANCHDSVLGTSYKFGDERDGLLAASYLLARGLGSTLLYWTEVSDQRITAGISFFQKMVGKECHLNYQNSKETLLFIERGSGFFILNKSGHWENWYHAEVFHVECGRYKETVYGFHVKVNMVDGKKVLTKWGDDDKGGFHIGPREALFLIKE